SSLTNLAVPSSLKYSGQAAKDKVIKTYLCPSDPTNSSNLDDFGDSYVPGYTGSQFTNAITGAIGTTGMCYAGNVLVFDPNLLEDVNASTSAETGRPKATLATAMPDGTSNTICFAHRYKVCSSSIYGTTRNPWWGNPRNTGGVKQTPGFGFGDYSRAVPGPAAGKFMVIGSGASFSTGTYAGAPGTGIPFQTTPARDTCQQNVTQSPHPGAMMVGLGDGSVRSVSPSVSTLTWYNACHPYDGNALGGDWSPPRLVRERFPGLQPRAAGESGRRPRPRLAAFSSPTGGWPGRKDRSASNANVNPPAAPSGGPLCLGRARRGRL